MLFRSLGNRAGANVLRATIGNGAATSITVTGNPDVAAALEVKRSPITFNSGVAFATQPIVVIVDQYGNVVNSSAPVSITGETAIPVYGTNPVNAVAGTATFTNIGITSQTAGIGNRYALTYSSPGLTSATSYVTPAAILTSTSYSTTPARYDIINNSSDTTTVTLTLLRSDGTAFTQSQGTLTLSTPSSGSFSNIVDNNDGSYSFRYTTGATAGNIEFTPTIGGVTLQKSSIHVNVTRYTDSALTFTSNSTYAKASSATLFQSMTNFSVDAWIKLGASANCSTNPDCVIAGKEQEFLFSVYTSPAYGGNGLTNQLQYALWNNWTRSEEHTSELQSH